MQTVLMSRSISSPEMALAGYAPDAAYWPHPCTPESHADHQFVAMLNGYRGSGGLARADEVLKVLKRHSEAHVARLARWIVKRKVICFEWRSQTWLPWFQFDRFDTTPQPELGPVFTELTPIFDPWELANWFAQPNPWLADCTPVETLRVDPAAVLQAARADHFIAAG
ncbi:hypothetical protein [Rhodoferax sediminis]|jgi:hypothetical protein|uniref:DUF2384 domain-containing protein n=1 Tax=Rhodoferax sediminis TaxID=2509614 RepID=A0A515D8N9_9BURK|nr:hypothetical protein [Rhodoferax sediminis]QDL36776.1 hypothetical protein EUB48_05290 [Rhodoferax sediminis]